MHTPSANSIGVASRRGGPLGRRVDCELPGPFWSGIPGILARVVRGQIDPASVERCDACERYPSDEAARERLREVKLLR